MAVSFNGVTISLGVGLASGANGVGRADGRRCKIVRNGGLGASIDPFSFTIPCDCEPQAGDTIEVTARTILLVDVTTVRWSLCGGECRGEDTSPGFSLGLEIKNLKWQVE